jgi:AraC-like DNA-binding protein
MSEAPTSTLPAIHALHLAEVAGRLGVPRDELLSGSGLSAGELADPRARLPLGEVIALVERARELTGEPGLGVYLGLHMQISSHGYLGFAAMTARTVGESLALATRFAPTRTSALGLGLRVDGGLAYLSIEERADLGSARDVIILAVLIGIARLGDVLTGRTLTGRAEVAFAEPPYFARFASLAGAEVAGRVAFGRPAHQLVFDEAILELPMTMADPAALQLAREQCELELDALHRERSVAGRARALLLGDDGGVRPAAEIARRLHMSSRTLKRRLADEGTSYTALLAAHRRARATELLRDGALTQDEIALALGYADAASFARAFRRWTGTSPGAYRRGGGDAT